MEKKIKYTIDFDGLENYLKTLNRNDFQDCDGRRGTNPYAIMKRAHTIDEIEYHETDKSKITLDTVIFYGMPFLCDFLGNDLTIIELSKKTHKLPNERKEKCIIVKNIINDCHSVYGTALNGYWIIPSQFIKYE